MQSYILLLQLVIFKIGFSQDSIIEYYDWAMYKVEIKDAEYKQITRKDTANNIWNTKIFWLTGEIKMTGQYSSVDPKEETGTITYFYKNGKKKSKEEYQVGIKNGTCYYWYENGLLDEKRYYVGGVSTGEWVRYFADTAAIEIITNYQMGLKHGDCITFYKNGKKERYRYYENGKENGTYTWWYSNGNRRMESTTKRDELEGWCNYWYENGNRQYTVFFKEGRKDGVGNGWYPDGKKKREEKFIMDSLVYGYCYSPKGKRTEYYPFNIAASFVGGLDGLNKYFEANVLYPAQASKHKIGRRIYVDYYIDEKGLPGGVRIERKGIEDLDREAIYVITNMPAWIPAKIDGEPVRSWFRQEIEFEAGE